MLPKIDQVSEKLTESEEGAGYHECIEEFVERRDYVSANEMSRRLEGEEVFMKHHDNSVTGRLLILCRHAGNTTS